MDFDKIYKEYSPKIFRICMGYFNDVEKASDLTQETFISVLENLHTFKSQSSIGTWIYRIATNKCLRQLENESRIKTLDIPQHLSIESEDCQNVEAKHLFLRKCIAELPEIERLIMLLYLEDLPQEKIADVVGISHSNIRVRVHRIKEKLTEKFKTNGYF